jgi:DnaJ-class molecular chaperone
VDEYKEKKKQRTEYYKKYVHGWRQRKCGACMGTGVYDHNGSPPCGACNGTGKERYKHEEPESDSGGT